jgi:probable F420-dependent oxidoreductase
MKYGFTIPGSGPLSAPESMRALVRSGEDLGFETVVCPDHLVFPKEISSPYPYNQQAVHPGTVGGACLDQLTVLAFIAGQTTTLRLGTSVMIVPHRNPIVAAKALATLDVLSNGRVTLGVGAGWLKEEFETLDLPAFEERGAVTDEYIHAFIELWTSDDPTFEGKYVNFSNIHFLPKPVQKPHIPIWVGGESNRAIMRAARIGNAWHPLGSNPNFPLNTPELLKASMDRLAARTEREGRDSKDVEVVFRVSTFDPESDGSEGIPFAGPPDKVAEDIRTYEALGVTNLIFDFGGVASSRVGNPSAIIACKRPWHCKFGPECSYARAGRFF